MKHLYLFLVCLISFGSKAQNSFFIQEKSNVFYINHKVSKGESVFQIARDFHVKHTLLIKLNEMGNETAVKYGQKIKIPLVETNFFKMGGLAEENGYASLLHEVDMGENLNSLSKRFSVSESNLKKWNEKSSFREGTQIIIGWVKYDRVNTKGAMARGTYKELADSPVPEKVIAETSSTSTNIDESTKEVEVEPALVDTRIVVDERKQMAERSQSLNPRYIDPNAPKVVQTPVKPAYRNYQRPVKPVKKEAIEIKDDTHDAWYKVKNLFGSNKKKKDKKSKNVTDEQNDEMATAKVPSEATSKSDSKSTKTDPTVEKRAPKPSTPDRKSKPITTTTSLPQNPKPAPKPVAVEKKEEKKSKNLWSDFKSSFSSDKDKSKNEVEAKLAKPKPVKNDPNRELKPEPKESKTKNVWGDLKTSFKSDKESPSNLKYRNVEPTQSKEAAPKKSTGRVESKPAASSKFKNTNSKDNNPEKEAVKKTEEVAAKVVEAPIVETPVVRNEIKTLNLSKSSAGKASYFFVGPSGGKFYVATNLAAKGEVVKVVNSENGKFVMAEVISPLPSSDAAKGILLKLSDNAKLPLGQKNSSFNVKVNY